MLTNNLIFIPLGIPILVCDLIADLAYFWIYNFNMNLNKIIIIKKQTNLAHQSFRQLLSLFAQYNENKIKSLSLRYLIKNFRKKLHVIQNIQFLMFGQLIPIGGFKDKDEFEDLNIGLKSMKTQELKEHRMD